MFMKWCGIMWLFSLWLQSTAQYHQTDYNLNLKIVEFVSLNHSYISNSKVGMQWFNRTTRVINGNGTLLKDLGMHLKVNIQIYKLLSNEYRFFPITTSLNLCDDIPKNMFGFKDVLSKYSNIPTACPIKKNFYYMRNGQMDYSQFPPNIPTGDYKLEAKMFNGHDFVGELNAYATITSKQKL